MTPVCREGTPLGRSVSRPLASAASSIDRISSGAIRTDARRRPSPPCSGRVMAGWPYQYSCGASVCASAFPRAGFGSCAGAGRADPRPDWIVSEPRPRRKEVGAVAPLVPVGQRSRRGLGGQAVHVVVQQTLPVDAVMGVPSGQFPGLRQSGGPPGALGRVVRRGRCPARPGRARRRRSPPVGVVPSRKRAIRSSARLPARDAHRRPVRAGDDDGPLRYTGQPRLRPAAIRASPLKTSAMRSVTVPPLSASRVRRSET